MTEREPDSAALQSALVAARRAAPAWNAGRQQQASWRLAAELDAPVRPRRWARGALAGAAVVAVVGLVAWRQLAPGAASVAQQEPARAVDGDQPFAQLADGSQILLDGPATLLRRTVDSPDDVLFELESGGARFDVAHRPSRAFRVRAGAVTVQVIGTGFHLAREDSRCRVDVHRGRVLVSWWGGSRELGAGDTGVFPPGPVAPAEAPTTEPAVPGTATRPTPRTAEPAGPVALFERADRARHEGHPEQALGTLREIIDRFPKDPHAPAAAFTRGRLLLEVLGKPAAAAAAFAEAGRLANGGPLAEDALAREAEALHRAGNTRAARERAELYRDRYPSGSRRTAVMRFGGLKE
jgi:transmembrane sensor